MRERRRFVGRVTAFVIVAFFLAGGLGAHVGPVQTAAAAPPSGAFCTPSLSGILQGPVPAGSQLILDISYMWVHMEFFGSVGYWDLERDFISEQWWQAADGSFYGHFYDLGSWQTFKGALSPVNGVVQPRDGAGLEVFAYYAHIRGTFAPGAMPTSGFLGVFDAGGTRADVLLGTYALQTGDTNPVFLSTGGTADFTFQYFSSMTFPALLFESLTIYYWQSNPAWCTGIVGFPTPTAMTSAGDVVT